MRQQFKKNFRKGERGNVLFLILIAVALFAALSYAVTSSSRSGGGDANEESALVRSAQITQYPSSVRTTMIRMMVSNSVDPTDMIFAGPDTFTTGTADCDDATTEIPNCVFHPNGGGATKTNVPADMMAGTTAGQWYFTADYEILDIGTSGAATAASPDGNDIIAFLPGITSGLCAKINEELGIVGDPVSAADWDIAGAGTDEMLSGYTIPNETDVIGDEAGTAMLAGQAFGCFEDSGGEFIYYHVLLER